jgi:hypothetical protein
MRIAVAAAAALALLAAGCGSSGPPRAPWQKELDTLCAQARADIEDLGAPADVGPSVIPDQVQIGLQLAQDVGKVEPAAPVKRAQVERMSKLLDNYYRSISIAYDVYRQTSSSEAYATAAERATPYLESAEAIATRLAVPECVKRPFADESSEPSQD